MKFINQSCEWITQTDFSMNGIKKFIERCARVSYKSEDKITDDSYEKFVDMLIKRGHYRPLEFGTVHLVMDEEDYDSIVYKMSVRDDYSTDWMRANISDDGMWVTTNYRYFLRLCEEFPYVEDCLVEYDDKLFEKRYTCHMVLNRGIMDEFRTHVGLSHIAESTRYCSYNKDKFDNQITFIIPYWCNMEETEFKKYSDFLQSKYYDDETKEGNFINQCYNVEVTYKRLLKNLHCSPQQAREVLPLSVKSELISCGFKDTWDNFFNQRCANDAHPMAREIAIKMRNNI